MDESAQENIDVEDLQDDDQTRAYAHEALDKAVSYIVITVGKEGGIGRVRSATDSGLVTLLGAMEYQIHRIKKGLDLIRDQEELTDDSND